MSDNNIECLITKLPAEQFNTTLEALVYEKNINHFKVCPPCFDRYIKLNQHRMIRVKRSELQPVETKETF